MSEHVSHTSKAFKAGQRAYWRMSYLSSRPPEGHPALADFDAGYVDAEGAHLVSDFIRGRKTEGGAA